MAWAFCFAVHGLENGRKAAVGKKANHRRDASYVQLGFRNCNGMHAICGAQSFIYDEKGGLFLAARFLL